MGALSTMQESQLTSYPNDLPIRTYDFHGPLGEVFPCHSSPRTYTYGHPALLLRVHVRALIIALPFLTHPRPANRGPIIMVYARWVLKPIFPP